MRLLLLDSEGKYFDARSQRVVVCSSFPRGEVLRAHSIFRDYPHVPNTFAVSFTIRCTMLIVEHQDVLNGGRRSTQLPPEAMCSSLRQPRILMPTTELNDHWQQLKRGAFRGYLSVSGSAPRGGVIVS